MGNGRRQDWTICWFLPQSHNAVCLSPLLPSWVLWEKKEEIPYDRRQGSLSIHYLSWFMHILHSDFCFENQFTAIAGGRRNLFQGRIWSGKERTSYKAFFKAGRDERRCRVGKERNSPRTLPSHPADSSIVGVVPPSCQSFEGTSDSKTSLGY